jgi:hypothetical protein
MGVVSPVSISLNDKHGSLGIHLGVARDKAYSEVYAIMLRLGTTNASLKLKGIDGVPYQLWIM